VFLGHFEEIVDQCGYDLDRPGPDFAMADHTDHIHAGFGA